MTTFDDRENAFEAKFAHDEEMIFKANARANKKLGLWAAEKLGKSGDDAEAYAKEVIVADFEEAGHEDVCAKLWATLAMLPPMKCAPNGPSFWLWLRLNWPAKLNRFSANRFEARPFGRAFFVKTLIAPQSPSGI